MKVTDSHNPAFVHVTNGFLHVCLCEKTCENHASLKELLDKNQRVLLHVYDNNGKIIPLEIEE